MHFLNQMDIKGITIVLCGSAQSFYTAFIFPKNLLSVSVVSSMWHAISCGVYLSQIVHQRPFSMSSVILPPPTTSVLEEFSYCVSTSTPPVQGLMGGHSLQMEGQNTWVVKVKGNSQSVTWQDFALWVICIRLNYPVNFCQLIFLKFSPHFRHTFFPKTLSDWQICTLCKGRHCSYLKTFMKVGCIVLLLAPRMCVAQEGKL